MTHARPPWFIFLIAGSFFTLYALTAYLSFWGPEPLGANLSLTGGRIVIRDLSPDGAASRAGMQPADSIMSVDGQSIRQYVDWLSIRANLVVGRSHQVQIERDGIQHNLTLVLKQTQWSLWPPVTRVLRIVNWTGKLVMLLLAFLIIYSRPRDLVAILGSLFLATVAISQGTPPYGSAVILRNVPTLLGSLIWIPGVFGFLVGPLIFSFCALFPRTLFRSRLAWTLALAPGVFGLPWFLYYAIRIIYQPGRATGFAPDWTLQAMIYLVTVYILAGIIALVKNYRRLDELNERRRVRVLVVGSVLGLGAALPWLGTLMPGIMPAWFNFLFDTVPYNLISNVLFYLLFPLSFAYAILRHRLFDIRLMIRQGVQYALARRLLISLVPGCAAVFLADLFLHGDQPLRRILVDRGWIYLVLGSLAAAAHVRRQSWLQSLDRRFFRDRYDAQRLLSAVVDEVRQARSLEAVTPRVVAQIEAAFHPEFAALLVRDPRTPVYRTLAAAPAGQAPPSLSAESKLVSLVRLLGKPLEISLTESGWLQQRLPHEDTDFLRQARIELLVPVAVTTTGREALLALGPKRSEEPYSAEDQTLLVAIASSLALLLERPITREEAGEAFEECPRCGACYGTGASYCAKEGAALTPICLPRLIGGRYRLDRRLGRGGMGTVYAATDTALERRVAVKVIREDRVGSVDAAQRFRREARAAAGFMHPNVVTVHDFGVVSETRAFLVMELLEGSSLREELRAQKRFTASRTVHVLGCVCAAVEAAHHKQMVHRDLKPENVFLIRQENAEVAKVLDFGLAKFIDHSALATTDTGPGVLVGTLQYMAPEQLRGEPVHPSWDLWALAVVAYEMVAGVHPFAGATAVDCQFAILAGRYTPLTAHLPQAPEGWQRLFTRAFALEPARRPSSARAFLEEFEAA